MILPSLPPNTCCVLSVALLLALSFPHTSRADGSACYEPARNTGSAKTAAKTVTLSLGECKIAITGAATVHSWGAKIGVNENEAFQFCFAPSTVVNNTFLMDAEICQPSNLNGMSREQCRSRRGNMIDRSKLDLVNVDILAPDNGWEKLQQPFVPFQFAANTTLDTEPRVAVDVGLVSQGVNNTQAQLGLGLGSSFINALKSRAIIGSRSWGLNSGSVSDEPRMGSLVLGGYDKNSKLNSWHEVPMDYPEVLGDRYCPLQLKIAQVDMKIEAKSGRHNVTLLEPARQLSACLEP